MSVTDLLSASRQAHLAYRHAAGKIDAHGMVSQQPDLWTAGGAVQRALSLRLEADALDPDHLDPAWLADQYANKGATHDAMVAHFGRYLTSAEARVSAVS